MVVLLEFHPRGNDLSHIPHKSNNNGKQVRMLIVRAIDDDCDKGVRKGDLYQFYIVDAHHHMGKEGTHRNSPAGAYEFYNLLWFELKKMALEMKESDELLFEPLEVIPPPLQDSIFNLRRRWNRLNHGWLVDRTIVFPYSDDYSRNQDDLAASFRLSNDKIAGWTTSSPHSSRLVGFCRIDPKDSFNDKRTAPINEIRRSITELGLRGLKLHPLAQLFIDDIESKALQDILLEVNALGIPVIFDSRNIRTALRIWSLLESIRDEHNSPSICPSIVLAHSAMSPGRAELYDILNDPSFFVDTSSLHDRDIPLLLENAATYTEMERGIWSEKILFGTDYSFLSIQAIELILYLLSREFLGTPRDIQNILGANALRIINKPVMTYRRTDLRPQQVICEDRNQRIVNISIELIRHMMEKDWIVTSVDYLPPSSSEFLPYQLNGVRMNTLVNYNNHLLSFRHDTTERELVLWLSVQQNEYPILNVYGSGPFPPFSVLSESSSESRNPLIRAFSDNSQSVKNTNELLSRMDMILKA